MTHEYEVLEYDRESVKHATLIRSVIELLYSCIQLRQAMAYASKKYTNYYKYSIHDSSTSTFRLMRWYSTLTTAFSSSATLRPVTLKFTLNKAYTTGTSY